MQEVQLSSKNNLQQVPRWTPTPEHEAWGQNLSKKADPPRYLWPKYEYFLMDGYCDIPIWET